MGGLFSTPEEKARQEEETRQQRLREQREADEAQRQHLQQLERRQQQLEEEERQRRNRFIDLGELDLKGSADFRTPKNHHWTSHQAVVTFRATGNWTAQEIRITIDKLWTQTSKQDKREVATPEFKEKEMNRLREYARGVFSNRLNRDSRPVADKRKPPPVEEGEYDEDKEHKKELCEYCAKKGYNCTRRLRKIEPK